MNKKQKIDAIDGGLRDAKILRKLTIMGFAKDAGNTRLNPTHYRTLVYLSHEGPACMHEAGRAVGLEAGSFTPVADRLIEEGLAERLKDPSDRRRSLLKLTERGSVRVGEIKDRIKELLEEKLSVLGDALVSELAEAMATISRATRILEEAVDEQQ